MMDPFFSRPVFGMESSLTPEQINFEKEFTKWDQGFNDWRTTYADHPDRAAFLQYEKRFLDIRDTLIERRAELKMKYKSNNMMGGNSAFNNDLCQASAAAESILAQFEDGASSSSSFNSRPNFSSNFNMMASSSRLPPVNPQLNYTHRKGQPPPSFMRKMMNQGGGGGGGGGGPGMNPNYTMKRAGLGFVGAGQMNKMQQMKNTNVRANAMNPNQQSRQQQQQQQQVALDSIRISQAAYDTAKTQDLPDKLSTQMIKRFKFVRSKEEGTLNEEEKTFIERYMFISRKRNNYLYMEREKRRREEEGDDDEREVGEQPAPPGDYSEPTSMDFTSDDVPMAEMNNL